jgi:hypothetical protein
MSAIKPGDYLEEDRGYVTPCWIWQLSIGRDGYGRAKRRGRAGGEQNAHALYYEELVGPIPAGLVPDHLCGIRECVNPEHLEAVTQLENSQRGARAKLTAADVVEIRAAAATTRELGRRFGIDPGHVSRIRNGHRWPEKAKPIRRRESSA